MLPTLSRCRRASLVLLAALGICRAAHADGPLVAFDVEMVVECREVRPPGSAASTHKFIEAVFKVSPAMVDGGEAELTEISITLLDDKSPRRTLAVVDFLPKTELLSDIVDPIVVIDSVEGELGIDASAVYQAIPISASGKLATSSSVQYNKLPPMSLLLASGTTARGHGVFYKLRPSSQTTLEGQRAYSVIFRVPRDWKADWIFVECKARGRKSGFLREAEVDAGLAGYAVGLYLQGDAQAFQCASALARQQQAMLDKLCTACQASGNESAGSWLTSTFDRIGQVLRFTPELAASAVNAELACTVHATPRAQMHRQQLPAGIAEQLCALESAKARVEELSGSGGP